MEKSGDGTEQSGQIGIMYYLQFLKKISSFWFRNLVVKFKECSFRNTSFRNYHKLMEGFFFFWKKECWCLQTNVLGVGLLCDEGVGIGGGVIVVAAWGVCGGPRWPVVPGDTWLNCSDFFFFFTRTVITARLGNAPERWVVSAQRNRRQQWARPKKHVNWFSGTVALIYFTARSQIL